MKQLERDMVADEMVTPDTDEVEEGRKREAEALASMEQLTCKFQGPMSFQFMSWVQWIWN